MAIVFPTSPSTNDTFTAGSITYKWDGAKWIGLGVTPADKLIEGSNSLEINASNNLVWAGNNVGIGITNPGTKLDVRGGNWSNGDIVVGQSGNAGRVKFRRGADGSDSGSIGFSAADNNSVLSMNVASGDGNLTFQTNSVERLRLNSDGKLILSGTARTSPFIVGDGGMCIEQSFDGLLKALSLRNKDTDAAAATALSFSLNRSGGDQDFEAGEIKLVKEQAWTTTSSTVDGSMVFSTIENGVLGEKLRITSGGAITKTSNPAFMARYSVNDTVWNVASDGWTKILFDQENVDKGGNYDPSTSEFTAPVDGMYLFGAELQLEGPNGITSGYLTTGTNWMYISFIVNGATTLTPSTGGTRTDVNFNAMYNSYAPTHLMNLSAGDTVCMYRTGNYTSIKFKGGNESVFWGYLVG